MAWRWDSISLPSFGEIVAQTSWKNRTLFAVCQAGLVNNLNDGLSWGLFPLYFAAAGLSAEQIGLLVAAYPTIWGMGQLATGALSDRVGRKWLIVAGMLISNNERNYHRKRQMQKEARVLIKQVRTYMF